MKKSKILIVSDMCGYGKVAAAAQMPILSYMGHDVFNLPTMLISNTFPYGKYAIQESTDYISEALEKWNDLGFRFDAITTGFMASEKQAQMVADYCREQAAFGTKVYVDPVMGDYGKLYGGASETTIRCMREMLSVAHLCFPNYTEACLLCDVPYKEEGITQREAWGLLNKLRRIGAMSVLITSCVIDGQHAVVGYNHFDAKYFTLPYEEIPVQFPGTGDIFSSIIVGRLQDGVSVTRETFLPPDNGRTEEGKKTIGALQLAGFHKAEGQKELEGGEKTIETLQHATRTAMDTLFHWIDINKDNIDKNRGIPIERHLSDLGNE